MSERASLTIERTFDAPAERVFEAFTSEEVMRRWWHANPNWETPEASVDLRVGGELRVVMRNPEEDVRYGGGGVYTEIEPPRRLAFTWLWDDDADQVEQLIVIDCAESGDGTAVTFTHQSLWNQKAADEHIEGWNRCFDSLDRVLAESRASGRRSV